MNCVSWETVHCMTFCEAPIILYVMLNHMHDQLGLFFLKVLLLPLRTHLQVHTVHVLEDKAKCSVFCDGQHVCPLLLCMLQSHVSLVFIVHLSMSYTNDC